MSLTIPDGGIHWWGLGAQPPSLVGIDFDWLDLKRRCVLFTDLMGSLSVPLLFLPSRCLLHLLSHSINMAKVVDRAIWSAGPVFIFIAVALIDMCVLAYFLIVFPYNHLAMLEGETSVLGKLNVALTLLFTFYMVYCIHFHYYMSIRTHPGGMAMDTDGNHSEEVWRSIKPRWIG